MFINLRGLDKYKSNHKLDGQTERRTRTKVHTGNIYEFVRSNFVTRGVTGCWKLMTWFNIDTLTHVHTCGYNCYESTHLYVYTWISLVLTYEGICVTRG